MKNIDIHPLFWIYMLLQVLLGNYLMPIITLASAVIHEGGHALAAARKGFTLKKLTIMPCGAMLSVNETLMNISALPVALAGPLVSGIIAMVVMASWWIIPVSYAYTLSIFRVNATLAILNLLPALPLDGSRAVLAVAKNKKTALRALRISTYAISTYLLALGLVSLFYKANYSMMLFGAMLAISAGNQNDTEIYISVAEAISLKKDHNQPIAIKHYSVDRRINLYKLIKLLNTHEIIIFQPTEPPSDKTESFSEEELIDACINLPTAATVADLCKYRKSDRRKNK